MPIYTKKGDKGETGLPGGRRLSKTEPIFEVLGALDSVNASLGLAASLLSKSLIELRPVINQVQSTLLDIGAHIAEAEPKRLNLIVDLPTQTKQLEELIDTWNDKLPKLENFILPGGSTPAAVLQLARTTVRQAERQYHHLSHTELTISEYLNRLSDFCFQMARLINQRLTTPDEHWKRQT